MSDSGKNFLISKGFDLDAAINYTGDLETYHEILLDFYDGLDDQFKELKEKMNDMPNYAILVHALKSNARTLGITALAEVAYNHELESKANNIDYVNNNIQALEDKVNEIKDIIGEYSNL